MDRKKRSDNKFLALDFILAANNELQRKALIYVEANNKTIDWAQILKLEVSKESYALMVWAKCIYQETDTTVEDPFQLIKFLNERSKRLLLKGMAIAWGLSRMTTKRCQ